LTKKKRNKEIKKEEDKCRKYVTEKERLSEREMPHSLELKGLEACSAVTSNHSPLAYDGRSGSHR